MASKENNNNYYDSSVSKIDIDRLLPRCEMQNATIETNAKGETWVSSCRNRAVYMVYIYPPGFPDTTKKYVVTRSCEEHLEQARNPRERIDFGL